MSSVLPVQGVGRCSLIGKWKWKWSRSVVSDSWTVAHQALLSVGFSRQEYWSGLPFPSPGDLCNLGLNLGLLHCRQMFYCLGHSKAPVLFLGSPYPLFSVSCGFTIWMFLSFFFLTFWLLLRKALERIPLSNFFNFLTLCRKNGVPKGYLLFLE